MAPRFNGRRFERAIHAKGLTAADVAYEIRRTSHDRLKTTERQIYKWIKGDHQPSGEAVVAAARVLDVTVESLYEADGDEEEDAALLRDLLNQLPAARRARVAAQLQRAGVEVEA
jgi:transcriptional regulator with XRE-family HTH domain